MANYAGSPTYGENIYLVETTDQVVGGPDGTANISAKELADRTAYFKALNDAEIGKIILWPEGTAPANHLKCNGARLDRATYQALFDLYGNRFGVRIVAGGGGITDFETTDRFGNAVAHGFGTEDLVNIEAFGIAWSIKFAGVGADITPATDCYVRVLTANTFSLHPSASDATNNLNAAEQISIEVGNYATVELPDKVSVPDLRSQYLRFHDDGLGVYGQPLGGYNSFGTLGTEYTAMPLLACIKYQ
jgi:microcystin-dependent protein